jgi:hypothetical protein
MLRGRADGGDAAAVSSEIAILPDHFAAAKFFPEYKGMAAADDKLIQVDGALLLLKAQRCRGESRRSRPAEATGNG